MNGLRLQTALLARRRELLVARCSTQREALIVSARDLQSLIGILDATGRGLQRLRQHPLMVLGATALLLYSLRLEGLRTVWRGIQKSVQTLRLALPFISPVVRRLF